jgi:hypothetical protein
MVMTETKPYAENVVFREMQKAAGSSPGRWRIGVWKPPTFLLAGVT